MSVKVERDFAATRTLIASIPRAPLSADVRKVLKEMA